MLTSLVHFRVDDHGALALDWVMLTAASLLFGLVLVVSIGAPVPSLVERISDGLAKSAPAADPFPPQSAAFAKTLTTKSPILQPDRSVSGSPPPAPAEAPGPPVRSLTDLQDSSGSTWLTFEAGPMITGRPMLEHR